MPNLTMPDLTEDSYEDLLQRFLNAVSLIVRERQVEDAKRLIVAIQQEWKRRRNHGDAINGFERPETGMLAALGYHVGQMQGQLARTRREILKFVLGGELPMVHSASYTDEWGEPNSPKRYWKLVRFLQNNIENNRTNPTKKLAVRHWSEDFEWVERHYANPGEGN
jgi:hypothetical protein